MAGIDFVAYSFPDCDTEDFIKTYMASKTRKIIDEAKAYFGLHDLELDLAVRKVGAVR